MPGAAATPLRSSSSAHAQLRSPPRRPWRGGGGGDDGEGDGGGMQARGSRRVRPSTLTSGSLLQLCTDSWTQLVRGPTPAPAGSRLARSSVPPPGAFSLPVRRKRLADVVLLAEKIRPKDHEQATRCLMLKKNDHVPSVRGDCEASRKVPACRALLWCCPSTDPPEWPITRYKINLPPWDPFESNPSSPREMEDPSQFDSQMQMHIPLIQDETF